VPLGYRFAGLDISESGLMYGVLDRLASSSKPDADHWSQFKSLGRAYS
jgi:hypothetical protein